MKAAPSGQPQVLSTLVYRLCPAQLYWLQSQTYLLCLVLFRRFLRYLRVKRIDQTGLFRLRHSLHSIFKDFTKNHLRITKAHLLKERPSELVLEALEICEEQLNFEYDKVVYVLDLFDTPENKIAEKTELGRSNFSFSKDAIGDYLAV